MGKVVKGVGRAVGKVFNGVAKVVEKVTGSKTLGKVAKVVAVAAAIYFTGGAALGALSTVGTTTSVWAGAASGLSSAWAGVAGAGSALLGTGSAVSGGATGLAGAANALGAGWAGAAGGAALGGATGAAAAASAGGQGLGFGYAASTGMANAAQAMGLSSGSGTPATPTPGNPVTSPVPGQAPSAARALTAPVQPAAEGFLVSAAKNPLVQQAVVQGIGGAVKGKMQADAINDQQAAEQRRIDEQRARYNTNVGANSGYLERLASRPT